MDNLSIRGQAIRILLTGRDGQVGFELQRALAPLADLVAVGREECDLANPDSIRALMQQVQPKIIVNAAAYTAVDKAESDQPNATAINSMAPAILGEEAKRLGAMVIHYSTDYVFDGNKTAAYFEDDDVNPLSVYGQTKYEGERALQCSGAKYLLLRTSWVTGAHGRNFTKTILRLASSRDQLKVVADQFGAPTSAALLADTTAHLISRYLRDAEIDFPFGLYHLTAGGQTSWHEYASFIINEATALGSILRVKSENILPINTAEYPTPARRPPNSLLDTTHFRATFGLSLPLWQKGVRHIIQQLYDRENNGT